MKREYKLAAEPFTPGDGRQRRHILQFTDDGRREVIAAVGNDDAMDVLDLIRRAYQDGREDNAPHFHGSGYGDPCYCSSPLTYAPQGASDYGSEGEGQ